jgi:formiminotetrahydrofolate cyclodeaminase
MMKLTEQEKAQLRASLGQAERECSAVPGASVLTMTEYFKQLEQFARIMPRAKPVVFEGKAWRL